MAIVSTSTPRVPVLAGETFTNGGAFTAGTTTILTLANLYTSILSICFDAANQGEDTYDIPPSSHTLTFTAVIPLGVSKVYVKGLI